MGIINVTKVVLRMGGAQNHYTYMRVQNLLRGLKGKSTKKEIQQLRKFIEKELTQVVTNLQKLENE
jgi:hypothetical protein